MVGRGFKVVSASESDRSSDCFDGLEEMQGEGDRCTWCGIHAVIRFAHHRRHVIKEYLDIPSISW